MLKGRCDSSWIGISEPLMSQNVVKLLHGTITLDRRLIVVRLCAGTGVLAIRLQFGRLGNKKIGTHWFVLREHLSYNRRWRRNFSRHYCIVLYCIALYCIVLYCIVLYCIVLYCIVLYCIVLYCIVLYCIVLYCIVLYCIVLYCIV